MNETPDEGTATMAYGLQRWQCSVVQRPDQPPGRWVQLGVQVEGWPDEEAVPPPISLILDPEDARRMGEALLHYSAQATLRSDSEQN